MADASKLAVTVRLSMVLRAFIAVLRAGFGPREWALSMGWAMLAVGAGVRFGTGWALIVGGSTLFAVSVFGVRSIRPEPED